MVEFRPSLSAELVPPMRATPLQRPAVELAHLVSHEHSQQHTVERSVDVPVSQVLVFEHIVKQIVDVPVTIP